MATSLNIITDAAAQYEANSVFIESADKTTQSVVLAAKSKAQEIAGLLQRTLNVEEIIATFANSVNSIIPFSSFAYVNDNDAIKIKIGNKALHSCNYRLVIANQALGEITFTRRKIFTDTDTNILEYLLSSLVYPLRNALLYQQALKCANQDPLTNVGNRRAMDMALDREVKLTLRHKTSLSLLIMDIDYFKAINDEFGHDIGDQALQKFSNCALECIRSTDMLFRYGGEEFAILMNSTGVEGATHMAERIRHKVENSCIESPELKMTVSIGVTQFTSEETVEAFFKEADKALYQAKKDGRNCVRISPRDTQHLPD